MRRVKIVGGKSTHGRVSILSDEFVATAYYNDGKITCKVSRHSFLSRFLYKNRRLPIPQLVRVILFFVDSMTMKGWQFLGGMVIGWILLRMFLPPRPQSSPEASDILFLEQFGWVITAVILVGVLWYVRLRISAWHGAEHMAIAAYDRTGATDVQAIAMECPVNEKCGGRLLIPIVVGPFIANLLASNFGVNAVIVQLAILEGALWVDALVGLNKIPITKQASRMLQRWVTTRYPGKRELCTAQRALQVLIASHDASQQER